MAVAINVLEHQLVELPERLNNIRTKRQLVRAGQSDLGPALRLDRDRLISSGLVGLVLTPKVQLQILPKVYDSDDEATSRGLQFLQATFPLALAGRVGIKQALVARSTANLLDVVLAFFLQRMADLLEWEFPREYFEVDEVRDSIAGRVNLDSLAKQPPGTIRGLMVRHAPLQADNDTARLCRAVVEEASARTSNAKIIWQSRQLLLSLGAVKAVRLTPELIEKVRIGSRTGGLEWLFTLADLLVDRTASNPWEGGDSLGVGILFRLEYLFEEAVRSALARGMKRTVGGSVEKVTVGHLLHSGDAGFLRLKPDLKVKCRGDILVGDVKWKMLKGQKNPLPSETDVYQLLAYARALEVSKCFLVYPSPRCNEDVVRCTEYTAFGGAVRVGVLQVDALQFLQNDLALRLAAEDIFATAVSEF